MNRFRPTLAIWGVTLGLGVSLYLSDVPLFQKDVLRKVPVVSQVLHRTARIYADRRLPSFRLALTLYHVTHK
jgi:hypothetical protein